MRRHARAPLAPVRFALAPVVLALALLATACTTAAPPPVTAAPPPAAPASTAPAAAQSHSLHWIRTAAEHRAVFVQTFEAAARRLPELVEGRDPFTWAISIDGDETILDNSQYQKEREAVGEGFTLETWNDWVRRREAPALPGAVDFLETVRSLGGRIAVVTNRDESVCQATEDNLRRERMPYDVVLCKPVGGASAKMPRWQAIERGTAAKFLPPLALVMWVGDNVGDFPGGSQDWRDAPDAAMEPFGDRFWMLPNPAYGSWENNTPR
jgi:5'-nucleotidase (lipoprotein e(P4) family)